MKSMIVAVAFLAVAANALPQLGPLAHLAGQGEKVCFQAPEACNQLRESAKMYIRGSIAARTGNVEDDAPKALKALQKLFNMAAESDCRVDSCKCVDGKLECTHVTDKIREALAKIEIPECVASSKKATARLTAIREAVKAEDKQAISDTLGLLADDLDAAIEAKNSEVITCVKEVVAGLRGGLRAKLKEVKIEPNCDFCQA